MLIDEVDETSVSNQLSPNASAAALEERRRRLMPILKYVASFKALSKTPENAPNIRPHSLLDTSDVVGSKGSSILDLIAKQNARKLAK